MKRMQLLFVFILATSSASLFAMTSQGRGFKVATPSAQAKKTKASGNVPGPSAAQQQAKAAKTESTEAAKAAIEEELEKKYNVSPDRTPNLSVSWPTYSQQMIEDMKRLTNDLSKINAIKNSGDNIYKALQDLKNNKISQADANAIFQQEYSLNNVSVKWMSSAIGNRLLFVLHHKVADWAQSNFSQKTQQKAQQSAQEEYRRAGSGQSAKGQSSRPPKSKRPTQDQPAAAPQSEAAAPAQPNLNADPNTNPWAVLGVSKQATAQQIKTAYKALILLYHPDKFEPNQETLAQQGITTQAQAQQAFVKINTAYEKLK